MADLIDDFASRADADAFEAALTDPSSSPDMARLVATARRVGSVSLPAPDPAFVASLASQLRSEAAQLPTPAPAAAGTGPSPRVVTVRRLWPKVMAGTAAGVLALGTGAAAASQDSLPGEVLYPVRSLVDSVEVGLAGGLADKGRTHLTQAREHIEDAQTLAWLQDARPDDIRTALQDAAASAEAGTADLFKAYDADRRPEDLAAVQAFTTWAAPRVTALRAKVPGQTLDDLSRLQSQVDQGATTLRARLAVCGTACAAISPATLPTPVTGSADATSSTGTSTDPATGTSEPAPADSAATQPTDAGSGSDAPVSQDPQVGTSAPGPDAPPDTSSADSGRPGPWRSSPPTSVWTMPVTRPADRPRRPQPPRTTRPTPSPTVSVTRTPGPTRTPPPTTKPPRPTRTPLQCVPPLVPNGNGTRCVPPKKRPTPPPPTPSWPTVTEVPLPTDFPLPTRTSVGPTTSIPTSATGGVGPTPSSSVTPRPDADVVVPLAPTFADRCTPGRRSVRIPLVDGVTYRWSQRMRHGTLRVVVDAFPAPGSRFAAGAVRHWEQTFDCGDRA